MENIIPLKWRPQTFDDVVGQDHVVRTLKKAIEKGEIVHGYLFSGTRGVGKTSVARILAKALNCVNGPTPSFCGSCENCVEIATGASRDVIEIDAASHTGVDNIREIIERSKFRPFKSRYKIYIIDEVHMLSQSSFNALLKTLEEPPEHVIFILATTEPRKIPETVLSRLQKYFFRRIPQSTIKNHIKRICREEGIPLSDNVISIIAREAEGSMRDAESLLEQAKAVSDLSDEEILEVIGAMDHTLIDSMAKAILEGKHEEALSAFDSLYTKGFEVEDILKRLTEHLTNLYIEGKTSTRMEQAIRDLLEAERFISLSRMKKPVMEYFLVKASKRAELKSLEEILREIKGLRKVMESGGIPAPSPTGAKQAELNREKVLHVMERSFSHISRSSSVELDVVGNKIVFTIKGSKFFRNLVEKSEDEIKKEVQRATGVIPEISVLFEEKREEPRKSIKDHPLVREFLNAFDGKIIEVEEDR